MTMTKDEAANRLADIKEQIRDLRAEATALEVYLLRGVDEGQPLTNGRLSLTWTARRDYSDLSKRRLHKLALERDINISELGSMKFSPSAKHIERALQAGILKADDLDEACPVQLIPRWSVKS